MGIPLLGESIGHTVVAVFWGGPETIPSQNRCSDISHDGGVTIANIVGVPVPVYISGCLAIVAGVTLW